MSIYSRRALIERQRLAALAAKAPAPSPEATPAVAAQPVAAPSPQPVTGAQNTLRRR